MVNCRIKITRNRACARSREDSAKWPSPCVPNRSRRRRPSISGTAPRPASCGCSAAMPAPTSISRPGRSARPAPRARSACSRLAARASSTPTSSIIALPRPASGGPARRLLPQALPALRLEGDEAKALDVRSGARGGADRRRRRARGPRPRGWRGGRRFRRLLLVRSTLGGREEVEDHTRREGGLLGEQAV